MKHNCLKHFFVAMVTLLSSIAANAHDFEVDGIFYNILSEEDRTVEVTYKGDSYYEYSEYSGNVAIPANVTYEGTTYSVTTIGYDAFSNCRYLTSIEIPNSVTTIGDYAFSYCTGLTSIEIPNSVTTIGDGAFEDCKGLTSIEIPNSVTTIGKMAFRECTSLTSIEIPNSVTTIGDYAFCGCEALTSIEIPNSVTTIGDYAFCGCTGLKSIEIPNSVTTIGERAFSGCTGLTSIEIPNSVTTIGDYAFCGCTGLTSVTIGNSVTTIGDYAFYYCTGLTSIEIPNSVTTIGDYAFSYCTGLTSIEIPNSVTTIGERAFYQCYGLTSVRIGNSVTTIGDYAFCGCKGLTSIEIPNSVTTIGKRAFSECTSLTSIEIPNSVTTIGAYAFYDCKNLTSITSLIPADKLFIPGARAFYNVPTSCTLYVPAGAKETYAATEGWNQFTNIVESANNFEVDGIFYNILSKENKTVEVTYNESYILYSGFLVIPANVTYEGTTYSVKTIGNEAFEDCKYLTSIEIPNSVTSIGRSAFFSCTGLTSIVIPNSITTIGNSAFSYCIGLTSIEIPNSVTTIGDEAFSNCKGLTSIVVAEDNTIYDSREDCNAIIETTTNTLILGCKNTIIPNSVITIGDDAFSGCTGLTSIEIPNSVTSIGRSAFSGCDGLTSIEIPNSVTTIGYGAFGYCSSLTRIKIPNSVTTIGESAFSNCEGLTSIEIPNSVTTIGASAFSNCKGLTSIEIPNSVTTIGKGAFYRCTGLTSVTIGNSVTTIGGVAFQFCRNLTSVTSLISANELFSIRNNVFKEVDKNACTLYVPYGAKETYAATDGWNEFTNIVELAAFDLTVSAAKYATLYLDFNAEIPEDVEVYTASNIDGNYLKMQQVTGVLPAKTGVIVRGEQGTYTFVESTETVDAIKNNLFRGSVEDEYITPSKDAKYYVLSMKDGIVGMYEDPLSGGTFKNNAHEAYLVLGVKDLGIYDEEVDTENPGMQLSNSYYFDFSGTTAIEPVINEVEENVYYDLSGRRVENPTQGIYIVNRRKVLIK